MTSNWTQKEVTERVSASESLYRQQGYFIWLRDELLAVGQVIEVPGHNLFDQAVGQKEKLWRILGESNAREYCAQCKALGFMDIEERLRDMMTSVFAPPCLYFYRAEAVD